MNRKKAVVVVISLIVNSAVLSVQETYLSEPQGKLVNYERVPTTFAIH